MKYAVCLSGEMRSFRHTAQSLYHYLPDADIYLHTWSLSSETWKYGVTDNKELITADIIHQYYPNLKQLIIDDFFDHDEYYNGIQYNNCTLKLHENIPYRKKFYVDVAYGMNRSFNMIQNPYNYDIIIRSRPDILILNKPKIQSKGVHMTRFPLGKVRLKTNDTFAWGDPVSMDIYFNFHENIADLMYQSFQNTSSVTALERLLTLHLQMYGVSIINVKNKCGEILRLDVGSNTTFLETHSIDFYNKRV